MASKELKIVYLDSGKSKSEQSPGMSHTMLLDSRQKVEAPQHEEYLYQPFQKPALGD